LAANARNVYTIFDAQPLQHRFMKWPLNRWIKILLVMGCFAIAVYGFMIKLPSAFRHFDKELHTLFYFLAAAFLNLLFAQKKIAVHLLIFIMLLLFGISIEYAQEYSNKIFHVKIHGRYDTDDVKANLKGLTAFSILWGMYITISFAISKATNKKNDKLK
jgi:hypothetical protein